MSNKKKEKYEVYDIIDGIIPKSLLNRLKNAPGSVLESGIILEHALEGSVSKLNGKVLVESFYDFWETQHGFVPIRYCEYPSMIPKAMYVGKPSDNSPESTKPDKRFLAKYGFELGGLIFINEPKIFRNNNGKIDFRFVSHEYLHKYFEENLTSDEKLSLVGALKKDNPSPKQLIKRMPSFEYDIQAYNINNYSEYNSEKKMNIVDELISWSYVPKKNTKFTSGTFTPSFANALGKVGYKIKGVVKKY